MTHLSFDKPRWRPTSRADKHKAATLSVKDAIKNDAAIAFSEKTVPSQMLSRVQRRLENPQPQDRNLLDLLRRRRAQPSQLMRRLKAERSKKLWRRSSLLTGVLGVSLGGAVWMGLFINGQVTYQGVPYSVIRKFLQDEQAKEAYFAGNREALHYRLASLGVERDIKNYYRDRFNNEYELDQYIHQIMFDRTGYVGEAYQVSKHGRLEPKQRPTQARKSFQ